MVIFCCDYNNTFNCLDFESLYLFLGTTYFYRRSSMYLLEINIILKTEEDLDYY